LTVSRATTRSAAMAWFDRPAASIRSTSSAMQMGCMHNATGTALSCRGRHQRFHPAGTFG
jgi:hypothetical protein